MAFMPDRSEILWPLTCMRSAWSNHLGWISAVVGLVFGGTLYALVGTLLVASQPVQTEIHALRVQTVPTEHTRVLEVDMQAPLQTNCTRLSQHLLYRDVDHKRYYYPLGSALNGVGFTGSVSQFVLVLALPADLDPGEYTYVQRSSYMCSWLAGTIQRRIASQAGPISVTIGE